MQNWIVWESVRTGLPVIQYRFGKEMMNRDEEYSDMGSRDMGQESL